MMFIVVLLVLVTQTSGRIINGTGEKCSGTICGYGAYCSSTYNCVCDKGFDSKAGVNNVQYCLEKCDKDDGCPSGGTCIDIRGGSVYRCDCATDYIRSSLGECVIKLTWSTQRTTIATPITGTLTNTVQLINKFSPTTDTLLTSVQAQPADTSTAESTRSSIGYTVSIVFNGIQAAVLVILAIILFRKCLCSKRLSNYNSRQGLYLATSGDNLNRGLQNIEVTSPAYQTSSPDVGIQNSERNDIELPQTSNYVNTTMYEDVDSAVLSNYANTRTHQSTRDYEGLPIGLATEQTYYEKLHQP